MNQIKRLIRDPRTVIVLAPFVLLSPIYLTGKSFFWGTSATQFVPWWDFAWKSILAGQFPLWNPLLGMGAPLAANYQTALFYPITWFYFLAYLIGGVKVMSWSISLVVCFHLAWSGLGTARLLKDLGVNDFGQMVGGLAFSLSGYMVARAGFLSINAAAAWLPWLLVSLYRLASRKGSFLGLTGVLAMLLLAGHAQTAWMSILLGGLWIVYWSILKGGVNWFRNLGITLAAYLGSCLLAVSVAAVQLLPTAEYLLFSQRGMEYGYETAMTYSFWPWRLLTLLLPGLFGNPAWNSYWGYGNYWEDAVYIGLVPFILAVSFFLGSLLKKRTYQGQVRDQSHRTLAIFLGVIIVISFLLALGDNTPIFPFLYKYIPGFDLFQAPTRYSILAVIALAILAGLGAHHLKKPMGRKLYFARLSVAGGFAILGGAVLAGLFLPAIKHSFLFSAGRAGLIGMLAAVLYLLLPAEDQPSKSLAWCVLMILLVGVDLVSAGWGLNPGIESAFYGKTESVGIDGRIWMPANVEYDLKFKRYFRFDTFTPDVKWDDMRLEMLPNLPMLGEIEMVNNFDPLVPGFYQEWMDGINRQYPDQHVLEMMNISDVIEINDKGIAEQIHLGIPTNPVLLAGCAAVISESDSPPDIILGSEINLLENLIIHADKQIPCISGSSGNVEIVQESAGYLKLSVDLDRDGWVFWSQTWYPGWVYRIDEGETAQSFRVNYLFQGASVPATATQVEFIYKPRTVFWGSLISGASLVGSAVVLGLKRNTRRDQIEVG